MSSCNHVCHHDLILPHQTTRPDSSSCLAPGRHGATLRAVACQRFGIDALFVNSYKTPRFSRLAKQRGLRDAFRRVVRVLPREQHAAGFDYNARDGSQLL
jgi:hypothetical protein